MRIRLWVPLPGPFAVTSGKREPRTRQPLEKGGRKGWFYWPSMPARAGFLTAWFWCIVFVVALAWNLGVALVLVTVVMPTRAIQRRRVAAIEATEQEQERTDA